METEEWDLRVLNGRGVCWLGSEDWAVQVMNSGERERGGGYQWSEGEPGRAQGDCDCDCNVPGYTGH